MLITVAICTWNRSPLLDQTLERMRELRTPEGAQWELLVVNNNCTDDTDAVLERHAPHLPLRRVAEPKPGHSNARNCALAHAKGEWVVWTDDDVLVDPDWLVSFAATIRRHPDAAAVGGRVIPWFQRTPDPDLAQAFPGLAIGFCGIDHGPDERELNPDEHIYGANMAYHRQRTAGLTFDPRIGRNKAFQGGGDDLAFLEAVRAGGGKVVWSPGMVLQHYVDPARMELAFLRRIATDGGEQHISLVGVPEGTRLLGMPRWLVRHYLQMLLSVPLRRLTLSRVEYLRYRRRVWFTRGMLRGCRKLSAATAGEPSAQVV